MAGSWWAGGGSRVLEVVCPVCGDQEMNKDESVTEGKPELSANCSEDTFDCSSRHLVCSIAIMQKKIHPTTYLADMVITSPSNIGTEIPRPQGGPKQPMKRMP